MPTVPPIPTSKPIIPTSSNSPMTVEERPVDLRLEQIVRARVVEGGGERALLELNQRHYRAQGSQELQIGQRLTLQVLQTHPRLEFRVLDDPLGGRLNQLLPTLSQTFDWSLLLEKLLRQPQKLSQVPELQQVFRQLQHLLQPGGDLPAKLGPELLRLAAQLPQTDLSSQAASLVLPQAFTGSAAFAGGTEAAATGNVDQLLSALQLQIGKAAQVASGLAGQRWQDETGQLLRSFQQVQLSTLTPLQRGDLLPLLNQLRQLPQLPQALTVELSRLLPALQLRGQALTAQTGQTPVGVEQNTPAGQPVEAPVNQLQARTSASPQGFPSAPPATYGPFRPAARTSSDMAQTLGASPAVGAEKQPPASSSPGQPVADQLQQLLAQVKQLQKEKGALPAQLNGQLEGLLQKLQAVAGGKVSPTLPGLEHLATQVAQLLSQGPLSPDGKTLGLLSQLFGFHLEAELLKGKQKEALASLKLGLLQLQEELGEEVKEPLQRLELLQLCKAKLAEEQVQFLPLPFNELEDGYLLLERPAEEAETFDPDAPLQLSLALRLSALGNMRIDMLYEKQGLHLRVACEDQARMAYLESCADELTEAIVSLPVQGVNFAADANLPAQRLLERLLPEARSTFNAKI